MDGIAGPLTGNQFKSDLMVTNATKGGLQIGDGHQTLSVVVLTYNEESRLRECLNSAAWCDELIVVDGYSTDKTAAIAREFTEKFFLSDLLGPSNPGGFAAQRNFALGQATCDWVFFLDADERFTPELAEELSELLRTASEPTSVAFRVRRREFYFGVYSPFTHGEAWQTRLVRRGQAEWDGRLVHEGLKVDGAVKPLAGWLLHYSKDSIAEYLNTQNRYTSLEAEQSARDGQPLDRSPWRGMLKTFLNLYIYKGSYREGAFGLIMSLLFAQYNFLCWAKRWEIEMKAGRITSQQPRSHLESVMFSLRRLWHVFSPLQK